MLASVITPVHAAGVKWLGDAYASLARQTCADWEWVLVLNNGGVLPTCLAADKRVRAVTLESTAVGALKRAGCEAAKGEVLIELDCDDMLTDDAVEKVGACFADARVGFAYSNCVEFYEGTWKCVTYGARYGWEHRPFEWQGRSLVQCVAWAPGPWSFRRVVWAPNHVRAWRREAYWQVGGHDASMEVGDDHDLVCRTAIALGFGACRRIDECLYLQRVHPGNTQKLRNALIQQVCGQNYRKYVEGLALKWAEENGLFRVDLGGRIDPAPGYDVIADLQPGPGVTVCDLAGPWPWADGSVGVLRASHVFEHLPEAIHTMNEAWRVLAPGGWLFVAVPSTDGRGAWQDPTHCSWWNERSFPYYTTERYGRYIRPGWAGRFQASLVTTGQQDGVPVVYAHLIALKPPYSNRPAGEVD